MFNALFEWVFGKHFPYKVTIFYDDGSQQEFDGSFVDDKDAASSGRDFLGMTRTYLNCNGYVTTTRPTSIRMERVS